MRKLVLLFFIVFTFGNTFAQTTLTEAVNFHVKTIYGEPVWLFPILDNENKIVVIDFFSTTCGPCQDYAPDFQASYESFGSNEGNVHFMGINWGNDNLGVEEFDSIYGLTFPTASGSEGGGNIVYGDYDIQSYPTVIIITPDHSIVEQYIWYPNEENITNAVIAAGGTLVGTNDLEANKTSLNVFPNPVKDIGTVEFNLRSKQTINLTVFNLLGKVVYSSKIIGQPKGKVQVSFSVNGLENGFYFVRISSDEESIATSRISVLN